MLVVNGPYRGSELRVTKRQPFHRCNPLRRVEVYSDILRTWVPLYLYKSEIKEYTGEEVK